MSNRRKLRQPKAGCPANLDGIIGDGAKYGCERPAHRTGKHRRDSPPVAAEWTDLPGGGKNIAWMRTT